MTTATSLQAWEDFCQSKRISGSRTRVIVTLAERPNPMTAQEIVNASGHQGIWKRLSELQDMHLVEKCEPRQCRRTGEKAVTWALVPIIPDVIVMHHHLVSFRTLFTNGTWDEWLALLRRQGGVAKDSHFKRQFLKHLWPSVQSHGPASKRVIVDPRKIHELTVTNEKQIDPSEYDRVKRNIFHGCEVMIVHCPSPDKRQKGPR